MIIHVKITCFYVTFYIEQLFRNRSILYILFLNSFIVHDMGNCLLVIAKF